MIFRRRRCGPRHCGEKELAASQVRKALKQLVAWPTATWMTTSESSWPVWSPRPGVRPRPKRQPARVGEPRGIPYVTSCTVPLLRPSRPAGKRCNRPGARVSRSGPLPRNWACRATLSESTPKRRTRLPNYSAPRNGPRQRPWPKSKSPPINHGDIFAFQNRGHSRWTTTQFVVFCPKVPGYSQARKPTASSAVISRLFPTVLSPMLRPFSARSGSEYCGP